MKLIRQTCFLLAALLLAASAQAQTYAYTNPTYIPTAILPPVTKSAPFDYTYTVSGINTVSFRVSGTCTSLAATPQITNDGTNWTTAQLIPAAGGAIVTSIGGTGMWRLNAAGMTSARLHVTALAASCTFAAAGTEGAGAAYLMNPNTAVNPTSITDSTGAYNWVVSSTGIGAVDLTNVAAPIAAATATATKSTLIGGQYDSTQKTLTNGQQGAISVSARGAVFVAPGAEGFQVTQTATVGDPCQNSSILKSSAVVNQGASATTKVIDTSASTVIYVCNFTASAVGTSPTVTVKTGTHVSADCDTGAASLTGAIIPSATDGMLNMSGGGTLFKSTAGGQICLTTAGSTSIQGIMTYVQQ